MTSKAILRLLRAYESRNLTYIDPAGGWPIVWERARGVQVWDANDKKYLDLTGAFGVAATGHANPRVVRAGQKQMGALLHAMGDVHPHGLKASLARELSRITFERWTRSKFKEQRSKIRVPRTTGKTIFCNSGFEAVEAALKTALLGTGKRGIIVFTGAYHGLGYGALNATHRRHFRSPFETQLGKFGHFVPFPDRKNALPALATAIRAIFRRHRIGAILVEPVQTRSGINIPPEDFLPLLRWLCDKNGALLLCDEIYTGFGRTGRWFACEHSKTIPDVICLGKALTGGFPLSACVGRSDIMDAAWPAASGEAIHTSTFLGHPVGCAMALAQIHEIEAGKLVRQSAHLGGVLIEALSTLNLPSSIVGCARGVGLMAGLELRKDDGAPATRAAFAVIKEMLRRGFILLPEGEHANVIAFTPPLTISATQLRAVVAVLESVIQAVIKP